MVEADYGSYLGVESRGFFWAEQWYDTNEQRYIFAWYDVKPPEPIGTKHDFWIHYIGENWNGRHIYNVYIDSVYVGASWQVNWIVRHQLGGEVSNSDNIVGPTHARYIQNRTLDDAWHWWSPTTPQPDRGNSKFAYYGDLIHPFYVMNTKGTDTFPGPDGADPSDYWPKDNSQYLYWSESGGNIYQHVYPSAETSHLDTYYYGPTSGSYLLMRRDKGDTSTASPLVYEAGFGDDASSPMGQFFGVWSNSNDQLAIGVHTGWNPSYYFYRPSAAQVLYNTEVARSPSAWHVFRFYIRDPSAGCSYGELDGKSLAYLGVNCNITPSNLRSWGVAATWDLFPSAGRWDNLTYFHR